MNAPAEFPGPLFSSGWLISPDDPRDRRKILIGRIEAGDEVSVYQVAEGPRSNQTTHLLDSGSPTELAAAYRSGVEAAIAAGYELLDHDFEPIAPAAIERALSADRPAPRRNPSDPSSADDILFG